ncbi:MAG: hemolysin family protein [Kiritimatiellia bacterium]
MADDKALLIVICIAALALGALFATLRSAFTLTVRAGLLRLAERKPALKDRLAVWGPRWNLLRSALLIFSMLMEVLAIGLAWYMLGGTPGQLVTALDFAGLFVILLLFTFALEVLPLALSESYADRLTLIFLPVTIWLAVALFPLVWPLARLEEYIRARLLRSSDEHDHPTTEDAIRSLVSAPGATSLDEEERDIIRSVFEFGETVTREIMTPRVDVDGVDAQETVRECARIITESHYSRLPVFSESLDDVQGIVHVKDILRSLSETDGSAKVLTLVKPAPFVPETMPINDLLQLLRSQQSAMAVVVDEYGGMAGLVTIEDIIEELVGDIQDEYDDEEKYIRRLSDGTAIINARVPVYEANDALGIHVPESDEYDSVGGYVFAELGRIPRPGEIVTGPGFRLTVQTADARTLQTIHVQKVAAPEGGGEKPA